jgi:hypothetical protein
MLAIAITTSTDATGLTMFSALPLFGLLIVFCSIQRLSLLECGLTGNRPKYFGLSVINPVFVMGMIAGPAFLDGGIDTSAAE